MKSNRGVLGILFLVIFGSNTQLVAQAKTYSEETVKKEVALSNFNCIEVSGLAQAYIREGVKPHASLEVSGMPINEVIVKIENETLKVGTPLNYNGESVKIYITYKELNKLLVTDAAEILNDAPIRTSTLEITTLDAGNAVLKIKVDLIKIRMDDSADLTLIGQAKKQKILSNSKNGTFKNSGLQIGEY